MGPDYLEMLVFELVSLLVVVSVQVVSLLVKMEIDCLEMILHMCWHIHQN